MNRKRVVSHSLAILLLLALVAGTLGAPPAGADGRKLNSPLASEGDVLDFGLSPDGRYAVYRAGTLTGGAVDLYSVPLSGGPAVLLSGALRAGSVVEPDYQISPDGSRVVFRASGSVQGPTALYSVPIAGPAAQAVDLSAPLAGRGKVGYFHIAADSSRVVYRADRETEGVYELYSVPLVGPAAAGVKLNDDLVDGGSVFHSVISPDARWVVYLADQQTDDVWELYSVPIAGPGGDGFRLNGAMVAGGDVSAFLISPDTGRVVYLADQQTDGVTEMWTVPLDGPAARSVKLNGDLVAMGNVQSFLISPDGERVVYLANQQASDVWELYSVPAAGPAAAGIKLSSSMVRGGDVSWFALSPDGGGVVYLADQNRDEVQELYGVGIAGPAGTGVKLNVPLVSGGAVASAEISPDSRYVVYRADARSEDVYELFSVPWAGPATAGVKLNALLPPDGDVTSFRISPDGRFVVYIADQDVDGVDALYRVPITGPATAAVQLSTAEAEGSVWSFQVVPDSGEVVYRADLGNTGIDELYTATGE